MDFFDIVHVRRSVRAFANKPVEDEKLQHILEAVNLAPSAGNQQAYEIYLVTRPGQRAALARAALSQEFVAQAPLVLVFCTHPGRSSWRYGQRGEELYTLQDATIACTYAMLAATASGLASVWVGAFDDYTVQQVINSPEGIRPVAILPIGYPAADPAARPRRKLEDLVHRL